MLTSKNKRTLHQTQIFGMCLLPPDIKWFDHCHREAADHPEGSRWPRSHGNGPLPVQPHPLHRALWYRPAQLWLTGCFLSVGDVCLTFPWLYWFLNTLFPCDILMLNSYALFLLWVRMTLFFKLNKIVNTAPAPLCDIWRDILAQWELQTHGPGTVGGGWGGPPGTGGPCQQAWVGDTEDSAR